MRGNPGQSRFEILRMAKETHRLFARLRKRPEKPRGEGKAIVRRSGTRGRLSLSGARGQRGHCNLVRVDFPGGAVLVDTGRCSERLTTRWRSVSDWTIREDPRSIAARRGDPKAFDLPGPMLIRPTTILFQRLKNGGDTSHSGFSAGSGSFAASGRDLSICALVQEAVIDVLLTKALRALHPGTAVACGCRGRRRCKRGLRAEASRRLKACHLVFPPPVLCTDNRR